MTYITFWPKVKKTTTNNGFCLPKDNVTVNWDMGDVKNPRSLYFKRALVIDLFYFFISYFNNFYILFPYCLSVLSLQGFSNFLKWMLSSLIFFVLQLFFFSNVCVFKVIHLSLKIGLTALFISWFLSDLLNFYFFHFLLMY